MGTAADIRLESLVGEVTRAGTTRASETRVLPFHTATYQTGVDADYALGVTDAASQAADVATRALQVVVAAIALVLAAPFFVVIAVAIKLTSPGPVFYKQRRVGMDRRWRSGRSHDDRRVSDLGGRPFIMYKFRTMVIGAEDPNQEVWATPADRRVTPVGRFLRATRLDELPQMINVLAGDMNIVGPRPERPGIFAELRSHIPHYHLRQRVLPGITGWAQVNLPYDTCVDDVWRKVAYDIEYLRTRSLTRDLLIMARTIPVMTLSKGW